MYLFLDLWFWYHFHFMTSNRPTIFFVCTLYGSWLWQCIHPFGVSQGFYVCQSIIMSLSIAVSRPLFFLFTFCQFYTLYWIPSALLLTCIYVHIKFYTNYFTVCYLMWWTILNPCIFILIFTLEKCISSNWKFFFFLELTNVNNMILNTV